MSDPLGGKGAAPGKGPQGAGHRWQAWAAPRPGPASHQPQVFGPSGLQESTTPPNPRLPGGWGRTIKAAQGNPVRPARAPGAQGCLQLPQVACGLGRGASSGPLTSPIAPPSCLSDSALPVQVAGLLLPAVLGGAGSQGGRKGPLGSENSQETQNREQQQQQETEGAGSTPALPPRCAALSRAPDGMG